MTPEEIRCSAPHPTIHGWACRARLYAAVPGTTVEVLERANVPRGCVHIVCPRCRTEYIVCPVGDAA